MLESLGFILTEKKVSREDPSVLDSLVRGVGLTQVQTEVGAASSLNPHLRKREVGGANLQQATGWLSGLESEQEAAKPDNLLRFKRAAGHPADCLGGVRWGGTSQVGCEAQLRTGSHKETGLRMSSCEPTAKEAGGRGHS